MRKNVLGKLCVALVLAMGAGCASSPEPVAEGAQKCSIEAFRWQAAPEDYDKALDKLYVDRIASLIQAEHDVYHATQAGQVAPYQSVSLFRDPPKTFISSETYEFAVRLRQLECASQNGPLAGRRAIIEDRFNKLLEEIKAKRAALDGELHTTRHG